MAKGVKKDMSSVFVFGTKTFLATMGKLLNFNLHSLLRNYLKLFGEDSCVLIHFITFTKSFLNTQNPGTCLPLYQTSGFHGIDKDSFLEHGYLGDGLHSDRHC
jgi:hypothetical protein